MNSPSIRNARDEEMVGLAAQIGVHPLAALGQRHHAVDRRRHPRPQRARSAPRRRPHPTPPRVRAAARRVTYAVDAATAIAVSSLCLRGPWSPLRPCREHFAHQPSGRTCTIIRRPHCGAEPRWLQAQLRRCGHCGAASRVRRCRRCRRRHSPARAAAATIARLYRLALSALIGICRSSSSSRSASAGRPSVVR